MDYSKIFKKDVEASILSLSEDLDLQALSRSWARDSGRHKWSYNFTWMGRPAIQFPNDAWAMQELIWKVKPDLIIESGIAHGGSLIYYASLLAMLDLSDSITSKGSLDPNKTRRKVVGLDIDIRSHNRSEIEAHPMINWIQMIEGSSISPDVIDQVTELSKGYKRILVSLDSNHTHEHVSKELLAYAPLVSRDSYCVVFDTIIEDMPEESSKDRPWGPGNNPKTAVWEFLESNPGFQIDSDIHNKLQITVAPDGYLKRVY
jgi:cephalosporin hydroxylase